MKTINEWLQLCNLFNLMGVTENTPKDIRNKETKVLLDQNGVSDNIL